MFIVSLYTISLPEEIRGFRILIRNIRYVTLWNHFNVLKSCDPWILSTITSILYFCTNYKYHSPQAPRLLLIMKTNTTTIMLDCVWNFCEIQWKKGKSETNYHSDNYLSIWQQLCTRTHTWIVIAMRDWK